MASRNTLDMTRGPILRQLFLFAYPLIITTLINTLYTAADKWIAGKFVGDHALAAIGACDSPINLLIGTLSAVSAGVSVCCGSYLGGKQETSLWECMHTAPVTGLLWGLLVGTMGAIGCGPLLRSLETPADIFPNAHLYMLIRLTGSPILLTYNFCVGILSAHGDTKRITFASVLGGLVNVPGNVLLVAVIPLGVAGVALATVLSQILSLIIILAILFSPKDNYRLTLSQLGFRMFYVKKIFAIGVPTAMNSVIFRFSNVLMQSSINTFGPAVIAGDTIGSTILELVSTTPLQMSAACSCAAAQCYGAKNYKRIDEIAKKAIWGTMTITFLICLPITVFSRQLMYIFTDDPTVADAGIPIVMFCCWGYVIYAVSLVYSGLLKGLHKTGYTTLMNVIGVCVPRVLWILLVVPNFRSLNMLFIIYPVSYVISSALLYITYRRVRKRMDLSETVPIPSAENPAEC